MSEKRRPEVLAPAGDLECLRAAAAAGADAVYFGLKSFNARARSENFDAAALADVTAELHERGVKAYVTLNTLLFDHELPAMEASVRACADAGVDAVIVQDLGVLSLVRAMAPAMPLHASTQMTVTDAASAEFARRAGASRVILARELSLDDIAAIRRSVDVELEVFVHGALCIAYSGQCLTSEAIGGRSANRGACAQACRLPYELIVDGVKRDVGERAYLLSPQDLEAAALVPRLAEIGVVSLKVEGRLKGPAYVAAATRLYRAAVDALDDVADLAAPRERALQTFSRGSGTGFLAGVDHQRLVEGRACDHRGVEVGVFEGVVRARGKAWLDLRLSRDVRRGDGVLVEGGYAGEGELGGRVWSIERGGEEREAGRAGERVRLWLGPDRVVTAPAPGRRVWRNDSPSVEREALAEVMADPRRVGLSVTLAGAMGEAPTLSAEASDGRSAEVTLDAPLTPARNRPLTDDDARDKLGRLGDTPFALTALSLRVPEGAMLPLSSLNRARRALTDALAAGARRRWPVTDPPAPASLPEGDARLGAGLFALCRTDAQAHAALDAGADGVWLDFLELQGVGRALRALRARGARFVGVAPPRISRPGEEKIHAYLASLDPDATLARGLGALVAPRGDSPRVGDFSLNVTNRASAATVLAAGLDAFTPSFDLDGAQLTALLSGGLGPWAEVVVHHPMPLFHMEHCVIAATLSDGADYRTCGRPCDRHQVSLRDRAGAELPVEADVACRNTVFHASSQSAAELVPTLRESGARRWRVELVRESAEEAGRVVEAYRALVDGRRDARAVWRALKADAGYGVVRGSLRVLNG
ncbi:MAG: U32 family peptidase [Polyangiales bacterium]